MKISALNTSKQNFTSNMPILHGYVRQKNGEVRELTSDELRGPTMALVQRLNNPITDEAKFINEHVLDYDIFDPSATSTITGRNNLMKRYVIFGEDAIQANIIRDDCYRKDNMSEDEVRDIIHNSIIAPVINKIRKARFEGDRKGEQVGLVLYTDEIRSGYNRLNGIEITSINGRSYAALNPFIKKSDKPIINDIEKEPVKVQKPKDDELEQGNLFDLDEFNDKPLSYWERDISPRGNKKRNRRK